MDGIKYYMVRSKNMSVGEFEIVEVKLIKETPKTITVEVGKRRPYELRFSKSGIDLNFEGVFTSIEKAKDCFYEDKKTRIEKAYKQLDNIHSRRIVE